MLQASKNRTGTHVCGSWAASSADSRSPAVEPAADDVAADRFLFPQLREKKGQQVDRHRRIYAQTHKKAASFSTCPTPQTFSEKLWPDMCMVSWRRAGASVRALAGVVYWG